MHTILFIENRELGFVMTEPEFSTILNYNSFNLETLLSI
jgi:hypothetical protein